MVPLQDDIAKTYFFVVRPSYKNGLPQKPWTLSYNYFLFVVLVPSLVTFYSPEKKKKKKKKRQASKDSKRPFCVALENVLNWGWPQSNDLVEEFVRVLNDFTCTLKF